MPLIAHRGLSGLERENTCPAFVAAGNRRYFGIETDVRLTKGEQFVLLHDETTDRVTLGKHNLHVGKSNYHDLAPIVLPDLDGTTLRQDIRIPLLTEYIKICQKYDKTCILEVKHPFSETDLKRLVGEVQMAGYIEKVLFISFGLESCVRLRALLPKHPVQWLIGNLPVTDKIIKTLVKHQLDADIYYKRLSQTIADTLHDHGIKVNYWTCDDPADAEKLVGFGVDFITTNILE